MSRWSRWSECPGWINVGEEFKQCLDRNTGLIKGLEKEKGGDGVIAEKYEHYLMNSDSFVVGDRNGIEAALEEFSFRLEKATEGKIVLWRTAITVIWGPYEWEGKVLPEGNGLFVSRFSVLKGE